MNVLYVFPKNSNNTGDFVILEGIKEILKEVIGEHDIVFFDPDTEDNINNINKDIDLIVVCGTPWIWDFCERSLKYRRLINIVDYFTNVKKIGIGLGSCFPLTTNCFFQYFINKPETMKQLYDIYSKFSIVITRDYLAELSLLSLRLTNVFRFPCPSAFCDLSTYNFSSEYPLLVYYDPTRGISQSVIDAVFERDFMNFQFRFIRDFSPKVIVCSLSDFSSCITAGIQVTYVKDVLEMFEILSKASFIVSGRVHAAIPPFIMGKETYILPVDTRFLTASELGIPSIFTFGYKGTFKRQSNYNNIEIVKSNKANIISKIKEAIC